MKYFYFLLFCFLPVWVFSLNEDSLKTIMLDTKLPDSVRLNASHGLIDSYVFNDPEKALFYAEIFEKTIRKEKKTDWLAELIWKKGVIYREFNDLKKATNALYDALTIAQKNKNQKIMTKVYNSLGSVYHLQKDHKKAKEMFQKSYEIAVQTGNKGYIADAYYNLGAIDQSLNDYESAKENNRKAMRIYRELKEADGVAYGYANLGAIFDRNEKNYDSAIFYYEKASFLFDSISNQKGYVSMLVNTGNCFASKKDFSIGVRKCKEAYDLAVQFNFTQNRRLACQCLFNIYDHTDPLKAYAFYKEFKQLEDSLMDEESIAEKAKRETQFRFREKEVADSISRVKEREQEALKAENEKRRHEQEVLTQQIYTYAVIGVALVVLIILFIVYRGLKQKKRANTILEEKNHLIHKQKKDVEDQKQIIEEKQKEITDSINYARRIQYSLLAHDEMLKQNLPDYFVFFKPKDIVSGDFYWCTRKDDYFYLAVCDSTGHGVPGAFMSLLNISFLNEAIVEKNITDPNLVLNHVRERLVKNMEGGQDGMDAVLLKIKRENSGFKIQYAAANNAPVLVSNGTLKELPADKMPVGKGEKSDSFTLHELVLNPGDSLFLYTDGYADQFGGPKGKKFKYSNLHKLFLDHHKLDTQAMNLRLNEVFISWKGELEQLDDVCIIGIKC